jgi:hypothetical protein
MAANLGGTAYAQAEKPKNVFQIEAEEKAKEAQRIDREYKASIERQRKRDGTQPSAAIDPWSNMRSDDPKKKP